MYKIEPCKIDALQARLFLHQRVKKSLIYLMSECIGKLKLENVNAKLAYQKIDSAQYFSPKMHYFHHRLQVAMKRQLIDEALKYLELILNEVGDIKVQGEIHVSTIGTEEFEHFIVKEAIRITKEDCDKEAVIQEITIEELAGAKDDVMNALCMIARNDPKMYDELKVHVQSIKLFKGEVTMGFTDLRILGAMLLRLPRENVDPVLYYVEHIIHEASHMHLNCLMANDPLISNKPEELFVSPLRSDLRPMMGVYHATFVSAKIARGFMTQYLVNRDKNMLQVLAETLDETIRGVCEIKRSAKLTPAGVQIIASIEEFIGSVIGFPEWVDYLFTSVILHRFGVGKSKVDALQKEVA